MNCIVFRICHVRISIEIDTRAGENGFLFGGNNLPLAEFCCICLIFKENGFGLAKRQLIENRDKLGKSLSLECGAQPLHIGTVGDTRHSAGDASVDIGLNGIGDHQIRLLVLQQLSICRKKLQVCLGVNAPAVNICFNAADSQGFEIIFMPNKWHTQDNFMGLHQLLDQLQTEAVEHIGVICNNQNLTHLPTGSFSS